MTIAVERRTTDLRLTRAAVDMARQLAEPDGRVVFTRHPLTNQPDAWAVGGSRTHQGLPHRQLLAYGLVEVAPCAPPYVVHSPSGPIAHPWAVVLTDLGRTWVRMGCPMNIRPSASTGRRRRTA
jgi:hypothetical protein